MATNPPQRLQIYPIGVVRAATNNFAMTNFLGEGAFGRVFRGTIDGTLCAVKRLTITDTTDAQLLTEISVLGSIQHPNLIALRGAVISADERCLIYGLAPGGDVHTHLHELQWEQRVRIALESGRGLAHLHEHNILHRDFKDANVLLLSDRAAVSDFGVARLMPGDGATHVHTRVLGTPGYLDPEYVATYQASPSTDVYAFGVFLLVLLTGRPAFDASQRPPVLTVLAQQTLADGRALDSLRDRECGEWPDDVVREVCDIARLCCLVPGPERLSMADAVDRLVEVEALAGGMRASRAEHPDAGMCVVCLDNNRTVRLHCGHFALCEDCARELLGRPNPRCPTCRRGFTEYTLVAPDAGAPTFIGAAAVQPEDPAGARAQFNLARRYHHGRGVPQDDAEAARWYRLAADQGHADAQFNLAGRYHRGQGVPQDDAEAARWYRLAADQGHARAQFNLGFYYHRGQGVPQDHAEGVRWYRLAADQGLARAQFNLAGRYHHGQGVPQDDAEAARWYRLAADQGHADVQAALRRLTP